MKIVVLDGYTLNPGDLDWKELESLGELVVYDRTTPEQFEEHSKDAAVLLTNKALITATNIRNCTGLKYIGVLATGYNIVDVEAARSKGIPVTNVPGYSSYSVAQLALALMLEFCHRVQQHHDAVHEGAWSSCPDFSFSLNPLIELQGKTLGIIGFGNIGQKLADVAAALGMRVIASSRIHSDQRHRSNFEWLDVEQVFRQSDFLSLHCPLTPDTQGLVNRKTLSWMKPSAFLINTSRGPLVVEEDLAEALHGGVIAGAGIDVLSKEPPPANNPLLSAPNCLITPHIAWATREARIRLMKGVVNNLKSFLEGNPVNVVN